MFSFTKTSDVAFDETFRVYVFNKVEIYDIVFLFSKAFKRGRPMQVMNISGYVLFSMGTS